MCARTSSRHADVIVNAIRVTAELVQAVDGALTHYRFPSEGSVVDHFEHYRRGVHLLFGQELQQGTQAGIHINKSACLLVKKYLEEN